MQFLLSTLCVPTLYWRLCIEIWTNQKCKSYHTQKIYVLGQVIIYNILSQGPRSSGCRGCSCTLQFWAMGACTRQFSAILLLIHTFSELLLTLSSFLKVFLWNCDFYDQNIFFPCPLVTIHQLFAPVNSNSLRGPCHVCISQIYSIRGCTQKT